MSEERNTRREILKKVLTLGPLAALAAAFGNGAKPAHLNKPPYTRKHLALNSIQEYGSDNTSSLPAWSFLYENRYLRWNSSPYNMEIHAVPFLTEANNGYGGRTVFAYGIAATYLVDGDDPDTVRWHALTTRTTYDGVSGGYQQQGYTGAGAYFYAQENPARPFFRGFNIVTVTDALNPSITEERRFFQGTNGAQRTRSDSYNLTDSEGLVGREYETRWLDGANVLRKRWMSYHQATWAGWMEENPPGETPDNNIYFSAPEDSRYFQESRSSKKIITYEDTYGNWISSKEYSDANTTQWHHHTKQAFASSPNTADWIVGKPRWVNVYEWDGTADGRWKSSTSYYYDGNPYLPPASPILTGNNWTIQKPANLRAVRRARRESEYVYKYFDTFYDYDIFDVNKTYGNRVKETIYRGWGDDNTWGADQVSNQWKDEDGNLGFDKLFRTFPKHLDNALGQRTTYAYDPKWGRPTSVTDPNGQVTSNVYDVFGRVVNVYSPTEQGYAATIIYNYVTSTVPMKVETLARRDAGGGAAPAYHYARVFFDGLGREVQRYSDGMNGQVLVNTHYNPRGLKEWESAPYFLNSTPLGQGNFDPTAWGDATKPRSQYAYDALRRPTTVTNPDNTQRSASYSGLDITLIDENSHKKVRKMDAFGRMVVEEEEYTGNSPWYIYATTSYGYNVWEPGLPLATG